MKPIEVYFGFYAPALRNSEGRIDPRCWLGHVEAWGYTEDETWFFLDPQGAGFRIWICHRHDEVQEMVAARYGACARVLRVRYQAPAFRIPIHGLLTCAAFCGQIVGIRALLPLGLHHRLLREGAEIVYEKPESHREPGKHCRANP